MRMNRKQWGLIIGAVGAIAVAVAVNLSSSAREHADHRLEIEGRAGVRALCAAVKATHPARPRPLGPVPASIPTGEAFDFPADPAFNGIGFAPPRGHFQYEVRERDGGAICVARTSIDGRTLAFELDVGAGDEGVREAVAGH